ncbi:MAG: hypothetical protein CL916_01010 [Deltaproteobacteria bacterium]|nr:hypothetical protein [Deltaproteobacteria bacterium]
MTSDRKKIYEHIKILRQDQDNRSLIRLGLTYSLLFLLWLGFAYLPMWSWSVLIPFMGIVQYYIVISGHEAVHKTLCAHSKSNEFFGVFGQALVGVNFHAYRLQHIDHHRCSSNKEDPDAHIYMKVMSVRAGIPRFLYLVFGTFIEILIKIRQKGSGGYGTDRKVKKDIAHLMKRDSYLVILAQLSLMFISYACIGGLPISFGLPLWFEFGAGLVWSYAIVWIIPLFCVTVFLNRCRIVIEHGLALHIAKQTEDFGGPRIPTIDLEPNPIERLVFAPFLFNYHCAHHLFMSVPHYHLPELHRLLQEHQFSGHHRIDEGYIGALRRAMAAT